MATDLLLPRQTIWRMSLGGAAAAFAFFLFLAVVGGYVTMHLQ